MIWDRVVACKPPDWFDDGSLSILAMYCDDIVDYNATMAEMAEVRKTKPRSLFERGLKIEQLGYLLKQRLALEQSVRMHATKLRLTVQHAIGPQDGRRKERGAPSTKRVAKTDSLLGGMQVDAEDADESQVN